MSEPSAARADAMIAWLRDWAERRLPLTQMDERRAMPPHVVLDMAREGLFGVLVPREYGGSALDVADALRVVEQLAAIDLTLGSFFGVDVALGIDPLVRLGSPAARERYLPALAAGRMLGGLALTEQGAGSDPRALRARVVRQGGEARLYGHKHFVGNGGWAGVLHVYAREGQGADARVVGHSVPMDAPGVTQGAEHATLGMRAMIQNEVLFAGVRLAPELELGGGVEGLLDTLRFGRLGIVALALGAMQRSAQLAARFASRRTIGSGRLAAHPVTRDRLFAMQSAIELSRGLLAHLADAAQRGARLEPAWFDAAKITVPELCFEVVDDALALVGGRGYVEGNGLARRLRDARLLRIFEGPTEALRSHLGMRALLDPGLAQLLEEPAAARLTAMRELAREAGRDRRRAAPDRRDQTRRLAYALGDWLAFALVERALPGAGGGAALAATRRARAEARFAAALGSPICSSAELSRFAQGWRGAIGEVEERAAGLRRGVDVLLQSV